MEQIIQFTAWSFTFCSFELNHHIKKIQLRFFYCLLLRFVNKEIRDLCEIIYYLQHGFHTCLKHLHSTVLHFIMNTGSIFTQPDLTLKKK